MSFGDHAGMERIATIVLLTVASALVAGCCSTNADYSDDNTAMTQPETQTISGTLIGGMFAIGGETTGWQLETDEFTIEVDVSAVRDQADRLQGQRVTLQGVVISRDYIERGPTDIFVASAIDPAE